MRHFSKLLVLSLFFIGINNMQAQDENHPWQIQFGVNAVDASISNNNPFATTPVVRTSKRYDIIPSISYLSVSRYVGSGFSIGARGSFNKISNISYDKVDDLTYYNVDGTIKYNFLENTIVDPFAEIGPGYTWFDGGGSFNANGGLGINFWVSENIAFTIEGLYKKAIKDEDVDHLQYLAGISFKFGGTDTDSDGINDKNDACPNVPGLKAFKGCPDTDSDGIQDSKDSCPKVAGSKEMNGCPDTDGDGIADNKDSCPKVAGSKAMNGCPDTDGDHIADKNDSCPNVAGPVENKGCPWTDKDKDGVLDKDDLCPSTVGTVSNKGCPEVTKKVQKQLNDFAKVILFDTGKSSIKAASTSVMVDIIQILKEYPNSKFTVDGYTDSVGSSALNQKLSKERATAVRSFLIDKGIPSSRLTAVGYGESKPIATNSTRKGRQQNRRVEINLIK